MRYILCDGKKATSGFSYRYSFSALRSISLFDHDNKRLTMLRKHFSSICRIFLLQIHYFQIILKIQKGVVMNLQNQSKGMEVFYDGRCGMCCTFHEWINRQPRAFPIAFIPYQAAHAELVFPGLGTLDPAREMIVRTGEQEIFRSAEAWVWCLFSCANHQNAARRLGSPALLPIAVKACRILAANRHALSKVLFRSKDKKVRAELHRMEAPECKEGVCTMP
jgi:predicted DCC family thiol-disulfide oxidoreductase YuxK